MLATLCIILSTYSSQGIDDYALHIICDVGCEVSINNGEFRASTAEEHGVVYRGFQSGKYVVNVRKEGFLSETFVAEVGVNGSFSKKVNLRKNNTTLSIRTIPSDCKITCDCKQLTISKEEDMLAFGPIASGRHTLSISALGKSHDVKLDIEENKHYYLNVDLLSESLTPFHSLIAHDASSAKDTRWKMLSMRDGFPIEVFDSLTGITFLYVSGGTFDMGGTGVTKSSGMRPVHKVDLDGFYMAETEVTQEQWLTLMDFNTSGTIGNSIPVSGISYMDCYEYFSLAGVGMRLPTEAEWEYACRAGTTGSYHCDAKDINDYAWHYENSDGRAHNVALKLANPWGFYDMHGNVAEWCSDLYAKKYYEKSPRSNPKGPRRGMGVWGPVIRGGSWYHGIQSTGIRSFDRYHASRQFLQLEGSAELNREGIFYLLQSLLSDLGLLSQLPFSRSSNIILQILFL